METLKERVGPLPLWAWLALLTIAAVLYAWWRNRSSSATSSTAATTAQGQVPEFVVQNQFPVSVSGDGDESPPTTGGGGGGGGKGHECSPSKVTGYTVVDIATANADRKIGAKVMALTPYPGCELIPWNGKAGPGGPQLFISTSWLQKHHKKTASATSSHSSGAGAPTSSTKAPARPLSQPTSPAPANTKRA